MHSLIDIIGGLAFGLAILAFWLSVHKYIDDFVVLGQNGMSAATCFEFALVLNGYGVRFLMYWHKGS